MGLRLLQLLEQNESISEPQVKALTAALVEAKVTQLPKLMLTASLDEKTALQVAFEKRLIGSQVQIEQCKNEAESFIRQENEAKATEFRNLSVALMSYQAAMKAIKAELEK